MSMLNMIAAPSRSKPNFVAMDSGLDAAHRPGMTKPLMFAMIVRSASHRTRFHQRVLWLGTMKAVWLGVTE